MSTNSRLTCREITKGFMCLVDYVEIFKDGECMIIVITIPSYTFVSASPAS